jgi:hypothetical protein
VKLVLADADGGLERMPRKRTSPGTSSGRTALMLVRPLLRVSSHQVERGRSRPPPTPWRAATARRG